MRRSRVSAYSNSLHTTELGIICGPADRVRKPSVLRRYDSASSPIQFTQMMILGISAFYKVSTYRVSIHHVNYRVF
jgi:hypothetical protein